MEIKDVEALAALARIDLPEEEKAQIAKDMEGILEYVRQVESADISDIEPKYNHYNSWREDVLEPRAFSKEKILEQFPDSQPARPDDSGHSGGDGIFLKVKKIL